MDEAEHPSRRPYKVKIGDQIEVEVATEDEVIALLVAAGILDPGSSTAVGAAKRRATVAPRAPRGRRALFIDALRLLAAQGRINFSEIPAMLDLAGPKGVAPFLASWGRIFADAGLELDDVIVRKKDRARRLWWEPGPKIEDGIAIAEAALD